MIKKLMISLIVSSLCILSTACGVTNTQLNQNQSPSQSPSQKQSQIQSQNSIWSDCSAANYYFLNNLGLDKSEMSRCSFYDLKVYLGGIYAVLVQQSNPDNGNYEYYIFPANADLSLASGGDGFKCTLPLVYQTLPVSTSQQKNYCISEFSIPKPEIAKPADEYVELSWEPTNLYVATNAGSGLIERVMTGFGNQYGIWDYQYDSSNRVNKVVFAATKDADLENEDLINPEIVVNNRLSDFLFYEEYSYVYDDENNLIESQYKNSQDDTELNCSFSYDSKGVRESITCRGSNDEKCDLVYNRNGNGILNHLEIVMYSDDLSEVEKTVDFDINFENNKMIINCSS